MGAFGERLAANKLEALGCSIQDRNVRVPSGEIDILATDSGDLVFVEVRTRRAAAGAAAESITDTKLERMWQCAIDYCQLHDLDAACIRLDLVVVEVLRDGQVGNVEHFSALELPD